MRMKLLRLFAISITCTITMQTHAQEMWGIVNSNFAGNMGLEINPASISMSPIKYELNIISGNLSFQNDYLYVPKEKVTLGKLYKGDIKEEDWRDRYTSSDKNAYMHLLVKGPSFYIRMGQTAFGLHASMRSDIAVRGLNYQLAKFIFEGSDYVPQQQLDLRASDNKITGLAFGELGVSLAQQIKSGAKGKIALGITINYLYGIGGGYIKNSGMNYSFNDETLLTVSDLNAEFGYSMPTGENNNYFKQRGHGYSTTLGFQYMHDFNPYAYNIHVRKLKKYKYKVGASLIDLGSIVFNTETKVYSFNQNSFNWAGFDTSSIKSVDGFAQQVNSKIYDVVDGSVKSNKYRGQLPTAFSAQFDYSISSIIYVNASLMQPLQGKATGVRRPAQFAITPRIELWRYELSFPVSMYEYKQFRAGMALRLGQVIVGSDYLTALTGLSDFDGMDLYVGIRHSTYATNTMGKMTKEQKAKHQPTPDAKPKSGPKPNPLMRDMK